MGADGGGTDPPRDVVDTTLVRVGCEPEDAVGTGICDGRGAGAFPGVCGETGSVAYASVGSVTGNATFGFALSTRLGFLCRTGPPVSSIGGRSYSPSSAGELGKSGEVAEGDKLGIRRGLASVRLRRLASTF